MAKDVRNGGMNARPLDDTVAGTGSGIPDDALAPGEEMPEMPDEAGVQRVAKKLGWSWISTKIRSFGRV